MLRQELKKTYYLPVAALMCIGIVILCLFGECYRGMDDRSYTVLSVILQNNNLEIPERNWLYVWESGLNTWSYLFLPLLLGASYIITLSTERQSGARGLIVIRSGVFRYGFTKVISAGLAGGGILLFGYSLYGVLMLGMFPVELVDRYGMSITGMELITYVLLKLIGIFCYGAFLQVFSIVVSIFFRDRYMLLCLPMMLKYIYDQILQKVTAGAIESGNEGLLQQTCSFQIENLILVTRDKNWFILLFILVILYGCLGLLLGFSIRRERDGIGCT